MARNGPSKPFVCNLKGCSNRFTTEDHLSSHRFIHHSKRLHVKTAAATGSNSTGGTTVTDWSSLTVPTDQTPTPTRFLPPDLVAGDIPELFRDIIDTDEPGNVFDYAFRDANTSNRPRLKTAIKSNQSDTLQTPTIDKVRTPSGFNPLPIKKQHSSTGTGTGTYNNNNRQSLNSHPLGLLALTGSPDRPPSSDYTVSSTSGSSSSGASTARTGTSRRSVISYIKSPEKEKPNFFPSVDPQPPSQLGVPSPPVIYRIGNQDYVLATVPVGPKHNPTQKQIIDQTIYSKTLQTNNIIAPTASLSGPPVVEIDQNIYKLVENEPIVSIEPVQVEPNSESVQIEPNSESVQIEPNSESVQIEPKEIQNELNIPPVQIESNSIPSSNLNEAKFKLKQRLISAGRLEESPILREELISSSTSIKRESTGGRDQFLERNRLAAMRCRKRKKEKLDGLQMRSDSLSSSNAALHAEVNSLREEVAKLKSMLLEHKDCPVTRQSVYKHQRLDPTYIILGGDAMLPATNKPAQYALIAPKSHPEHS